MQACRAYYENGKFVPLESIEIPEGSQAIVTILDFSMNDINFRLAESIHAKAWQEFLEELSKIEEPLGDDFDEVMSKRVNFTRELDL